MSWGEREPGWLLEGITLEVSFILMTKLSGNEKLFIKTGGSGDK